MEFVAGIPWRERQREFDAGRIHVCWMCGLPYVWTSDRSEPHPVLLAALVSTGARYADRPVYFSDVVVRRESAWTSFAGLEGATWAYNEDGSHSGYNAVRERLARLGRPRGFFGTVIASGSHEASLGLLLSGEVDACAVDSTVLDLLGRDEPTLGLRLRVIDSLGPSPAPPWVISPVVPGPLRRPSSAPCSRWPAIRAAVSFSTRGWPRGSRPSAIRTTTRSGEAQLVVL